MNAKLYLYAPVATTFLCTFFLIIGMFLFNQPSILIPFVMLLILFSFLFLSILSLFINKKLLFINFIVIFLSQSFYYFYKVTNPLPGHYFESGGKILIENGIITSTFYIAIIKEIIIYNFSLLLSYPLFNFILSKNDKIHKQQVGNL